MYFRPGNDTRAVSFGELYERALGILYHLQRLGARRGDKLILFLGSNEVFVDAFWAAVLGGIVPVPVSIGISDEQRHKLLRVARRLPPRPARARYSRHCAHAPSSWTTSTTFRAPAACSG